MSIFHRIRLVISFSALVCLGGACATSVDEPDNTTEVRGGFVADEADLHGEVSDEQVEGFAEAYVEVRAIQQRYHTPITQADGEERERLIKESETEIEAVIVGYGLSVSEFNAIAVRMAQDEELRGRVQEQVRLLEIERMREYREAEGME